MAHRHERSPPTHPPLSLCPEMLSSFLLSGRGCSYVVYPNQTLIQEVEAMGVGDGGVGGKELLACVSSLFSLLVEKKQEQLFT